MSVINKMLRDLDQRNSEPSAERKQTVSVDATRLAPPRRKPGVQRRATLIALTLLLLAAAAWWAWQHTHRADVPAINPQPGIAVASASMSAQASAPVVVASAAVAPVSAPEPAAVSVSAPDPMTSAPARASAVLVPAVPAAPVNTPLKIETTLKLPKAVKEPASEPVTPPPVAPVPVVAGQRLLQAGREAQIQAQSLWSSGAKEAAMDLLQQAVVNLERGIASEPVQGQLPLLSALARDLTRMQLADGRAGAAWDLLVRLEPLVRNDADLWAVRGNAAQRLGRHQDSVHAYLAALQSRPNEQRWMLGAAVSLAASGQTTAAAEMVEKARAVGSISPEVQAYLRQSGVPLKDK